MTPAERALLLAVAKELLDRIPALADRRRGLASLIAAVEAEAAPEAPTDDKSCENCRWSHDPGPTASFVCRHGNGKNCGDFTLWQPKPTEADVCPTCGGNGSISMGNGMYPDCDDCNGKKEKK